MTTVGLSAGGMVLTKKGSSFSYIQDNVNWLRTSDNLSIRIERIDEMVARVSPMDADQVQLIVPATIKMTRMGGCCRPTVHE